MSLLSTVRAALFGGNEPLSLPRIEGLSLLGGVKAFTSLDDPAVIEFLRDGRETSTGEIINERVALRNSGGYRAVGLISSALGMLPLPLFKKIEETRQIPGDPETGKAAETVTSTGAERASDHPVYRILMKRPNPWMTPFEFKSFMVQRAMWDGIAYAVKKHRVSARTRGGRVVSELIPLQSRLVEPRMSPQWVLSFRYHDPHGPPIDIPIEDMFWFRSPMSSDGVTGAKLLDVAAEAIGLSRSSERASGRVLKNGAIVGGVLQHPKALSDEAIERLRTQFEERQSTPENAGKWIVAEDGLEAKPFGHTLKDSQNAELRKFQIEEMARFTGVPRPLLMLDETSWGTGIEQLGLFLITYCLLPWFITIEEAISRSLLSEEEQEDYYPKFNEGALLRGSLKDQAEFFAKALGSGGGRGWMTQNEVRDKSELNPKEGGDELPEPITKAPNEGSGASDPEDKGDAAGGGSGKRPKAPTSD